MAVENIYEKLTDEQREEAKACKTPGEMLELTKKWGMTLSDEELDAIAGGGAWSDSCPYCPKDSQAWS